MRKDSESIWSTYTRGNPQICMQDNGTISIRFHSTCAYYMRRNLIEQIEKNLPVYVQITVSVKASHQTQHSD